MKQAGIGAAESIDRLLRVADDEQLAWCGCGLSPVALGGVCRREEQQNFGLERVGILELIDENAVVELLEVGACAIVTEEIAGVEQQVHEVELTGAPLLLLVQARHLPKLLAERGGEIGVGQLPERLDLVPEIVPAFDPAQVDGQAEEVAFDAVAIHAARAVDEFGDRTDVPELFGTI